MSRMFEVPRGERGMVHVLSCDWPLEDLFDAGGDVTPLAEALGLPLDARYVDVIETASLGVDLADYLAQAHDVTLAAADKLLINAITPTAVLILSPAVQGPVSVGLPDALSLVVSLQEPEAAHTLNVDPPPKSAEGQMPEETAPPPKSDARIGGMVALVALIVIFAVFGLMIWIAA